MEYIVLAVVAVVALCAGYGLGIWAVKQSLNELSRREAVALTYYLTAVRREIGNVLMQRKHHHFLDIKKQALRELERIKDLEQSDCKKEHAALCKKYEEHIDFSPFNVRDHILYADAAEGFSNSDLEKYYLDIIRYMALNKRLDLNWPLGFVLRKRDLQHLEEYVRKLDDTQLKLRLKGAIEEYFTYCGEKISLENRRFSVSYIWHFAENRYGVHFKETNEYGIYAVFSDGDKDHVSFYRSDPTFTVEKTLHCFPNGVVTLPVETWAAES